MACPNQDVVYGAGIAALDEGPVVVQVPDFKGRFWVYQIVDLRTDSFADLGVMYGSAPGFYLLVGPGWQGDTPRGIAKVFRSSTNTAMVVPRVFQDDTPADKRTVQPLIASIDMYPLAKFDGTLEQRDWRLAPTLKSPAGDAGEADAKLAGPPWSSTCRRPRAVPLPATSSTPVRCRSRTRGRTARTRARAGST